MKEKGTGLGLIICKDFTDVHHGRIKVESQEGEGSSFMVCLPLKDKKKSVLIFYFFLKPPSNHNL